MVDKTDKGWECMLQCPTCNAQPGFACRTPRKRKKKTAHTTRPFFIPKSAIDDLLNPTENSHDQDNS